jgi:regulator of sirC expression with transglutaminase-like and TPR domain
LVSEPQFGEALKSRPIDLPQAALRFAREIAYPDLDVHLYTGILDRLVDWAQEAAAPARTLSAKIDVVADFLFHRFEFRGNAADYNDPRNSYLNEVLERRLGIPISLSVVFLAVSQGVGLPAQGVGLPGHFIVRVQTGQEPVYLDPFQGGQRLSISDCANLVYTSTGYQGEFQMEWLDPTPPRDILARMLNNLRNIYIQEGDWTKSLAVLERLHLAQPDHPQHLLDLGLIHHQYGLLRRAVDYYERFLTIAPEDPGAAEAQQNLVAAARRLVQLN